MLTWRVRAALTELLERRKTEARENYRLEVLACAMAGATIPDPPDILDAE